MHRRLQRLQRIFGVRFIIVFLLSIIVFLLNFRDLYELSSSLSHNISTIQRDSNTSISLVEMAKKYRTSKGRLHNYTRFYEHYLSKYRNTNFSLLEIGLGCGMPWGVGVSAAMWREYFGPKANIHFIEYDKECADEWLNESGRELNVIMHYGSQDDILFLKVFANNHTNSFDAIIDDGGHRMSQQIDTLTVLFPTALRSGGTYAIEDIYTSYLSKYGGKYLKPSTLVEFLKRLIDDIQSKSPTHKTSALGPLIDSLEISNKLCLLTKK